MLYPLSYGRVSHLSGQRSESIREHRPAREIRPREPAIRDRVAGPGGRDRTAYQPVGPRVRDLIGAERFPLSLPVRSTSYGGQIALPGARTTVLARGTRCVSRCEYGEHIQQVSRRIPSEVAPALTGPQAGHTARNRKDNGRR